MSKRVFTASEIARLLKGQVEGPDFVYVLGENFRAVQMASKDGLVFSIERGSIRNGADYYLKDASPAALAEISEILWTRLGPQFETSSVEDILTPDELKEPVDDLPVDESGLKPDWYRRLEKEEKDESVLSREEQLVPNHLRDIVADPALARRLHDGTATAQEKLDDLLIPDNLK